MWSKELVELLIKKYKEHENLYDVSNPFYIDRIKRSNSLLKICEELQKVDKKVTVEDIKKKIHTLRAQYLKGCRELANSKQNSAGSEDEYGPKLWCFNQLHFLKEHCGVRKPIPISHELNRIDEKDMYEETPKAAMNKSTTAFNSNNSSNTASFKERRSRIDLEEKVDKIKTILIARLTERKEYDWLGKQVVFEINSLKDESLKRDTVWKIQSILRDAYLMDNEPESD